MHDANRRIHEWMVSLMASKHILGCGASPIGEYHVANLLKLGVEISNLTESKETAW